MAVPPTLPAAVDLCPRCQIGFVLSSLSYEQFTITHFSRSTCRDFRSAAIGFVWRNRPLRSPSQPPRPELASFCTNGTNESMEFLFPWCDCRVSLFQEALLIIRRSRMPVCYAKIQNPAQFLRRRTSRRCRTGRVSTGTGVRAMGLVASASCRWFMGGKGTPSPAGWAVPTTCRPVCPWRIGGHSPPDGNWATRLLRSGQASTE